MDDENRKNDIDTLSELGELDVGSTEEDLEKDDNALDAAHSMGIGKDASESHPAPLGLSEDDENNERLRHGQPPSAQKYSGELGGEKYEATNK